MQERQPVWPLHELCDRARELVAEYWDVNSQVCCAPNPHPRVCWSPLPEDCYKANFDGTFSKDSGSTAIGVVYRDFSGQVIVALC
nr:hypothetical protein CFP56_01490 [Quercus suber]